jgi:two-component system nitrate/nitrite response regulator NarL
MGLRFSNLPAIQGSRSVRVDATNSGERIRVLLINADNMLSELLVKALKNSRNRFDIEALAGSSTEVIRRLGKSKPHVALVSATLQDGPQAGFAVLQKLREARPETAVVMLLDLTCPAPVVEAFRQGARGVFCRVQSVNELSKCICAVHQGQIWASNEDIECLLQALARTKPVWLNGNGGMASLTRREEEVARLVADGLRNREIAESLGVTEHAVRNYLYRIFDKLGISNRVELVLYAVARPDEAAAGVRPPQPMPRPALYPSAKKVS